MSEFQINRRHILKAAAGSALRAAFPIPVTLGAIGGAAELPQTAAAAAAPEFWRIELISAKMAAFAFADESKPGLYKHRIHMLSQLYTDYEEWEIQYSQKHPEYKRTLDEHADHSDLNNPFLSRSLSSPLRHDDIFKEIMTLMKDVRDSDEVSLEEVYAGYPLADFWRASEREGYQNLSLKEKLSHLMNPYPFEGEPFGLNYSDYTMRCEKLLHAMESLFAEPISNQPGSKAVTIVNGLADTSKFARVGSILSGAISRLQDVLPPILKTNFNAKAVPSAIGYTVPDILEQRLNTGNETMQLLQRSKPPEPPEMV